MRIELQSARLTLRPPVQADFEAFAAMWAEESVNRYISGHAQTRAESEARFGRVCVGWAQLGHGFFSVFEHTGRYIGQTGFFKVERNLGPDFDTAVEAGWTFIEAAGKQGYATEATLTAHDWFDAQPFAQRTVCMIAPAHAASIRVAEKCGYAEMGRAVYAEDPVMLMQRACPA